MYRRTFLGMLLAALGATKLAPAVSVAPGAPPITRLVPKEFQLEWQPLVVNVIYNRGKEVCFTAVFMEPVLGSTTNALIADQKFEQVSAVGFLVDGETPISVSFTRNGYTATNIQPDDIISFEIGADRKPMVKVTR